MAKQPQPPPPRYRRQFRCEFIKTPPSIWAFRKWERNPRPTQAENMVDLISVIRTRSTCPKGKQHAALIEQDGTVLALGYNGCPRGWESEEGCNLTTDQYGKDYRLCPCIHAEVNCIINAAREGIAIKGGWMYCTKRPCDACALVIENAGIENCYYLED